MVVLVNAHPLGCAANQCLCPSGNMNNGRHKALTVRIRDQNGKARVHYAGQGVGRAKVDADDIAHIRTVAAVCDRRQLPPR
jgi:hypothetical protein